MENFSAYHVPTPRMPWYLGPGELPDRHGDGDGTDLPVEPDQGMPLLPDDDGVVTVPS